MGLEPADVGIGDDDQVDPEQRDMSRRLVLALILGIPVVALGLPGMLPGLESYLPLTGRLSIWLQMGFAAPLVLYCGWPFFVRGWASIVSRRLNMFTLIATGTGTALLYSAAATLAPGLFPEPFHAADGSVPVYFESAAVIVILVLLGQVLELRARDRTRGALRQTGGAHALDRPAPAAGRARGGDPGAGDRRR